MAPPLPKVHLQIISSVHQKPLGCRPRTPALRQVVRRQAWRRWRRDAREAAARDQFEPSAEWDGGFDAAWDDAWSLQAVLYVKADVPEETAPDVSEEVLQLLERGAQDAEERGEEP